MSEQPDEAARRALTELIRSSGRDVLATLARVTGDLALAEDAVQDATIKALETWPRDGVPDNPGAWLRLSARRRAIDLIRREATRFPKESAAMAFAEAHEADDQITESVIDDDLLRLIFTCCHPSLAAETQVSLALRTLCGFTTAEVARALLVPEATMSKRLTRARQKIRLAGIPYRIPTADDLPDRWAAVLATTYLVFNEGYTATSGHSLSRDDLADEAIRLGRLLVRLRPGDASAQGLLALMLLHDSRRETRTTADGAVVLLADQDRLSWKAGQIEEAVRLVGEALRRTPDHPDTYVVQAAIAACHALAPTYSDTQWDAIISWYDVLLRIEPGPVVELNRAVAIAERDGPAVGLALMDEISRLDGYAVFHACRAVLLRRLDRHDEAQRADERAASLPLNDPQRRRLHAQPGQWPNPLGD